MWIECQRGIFSVCLKEYNFRNGYGIIFNDTNLALHICDRNPHWIATVSSHFEDADRSEIWAAMERLPCLRGDLKPSEVALSPLRNIGEFEEAILVIGGGESVDPGRKEKRFWNLISVY